VKPSFSVPRFPVLWIALVLPAGLWAQSAPPISKVFGATHIPLGGSTTLSFTIDNTDPINTVFSINFADTLPAGLVVSTPNGLTGSCGGGDIAATEGGNEVDLGDVTRAILLPNTSCTFSVNVTGIAAGVQNNTTSAVSCDCSPTDQTASASVTVDPPSPPTISKSFGAASIGVNGSTSLSFTITNPNVYSSLSGVGFSDTLPTGLVVSTPNGLSGSCGGGGITAMAASNSVSLSGAALAASGSCTFSVNVTGSTTGTKNNITGAVTSTEGGTGLTASASLTVLNPPTISKLFGAASITVNGSTSLSFTIINPNAGTSLTGVGFTDTLPAGLVVSSPNGLSGSCGGGGITATPASGSVSLLGATLAASASCTFSVNVTGTTTGTKNNITGAVSSTQTGAGSTASASLAVQPPAIPVLSPWALAGLALLLAGMGWVLARKAQVQRSRPNV